MKTGPCEIAQSANEDKSLLNDRAHGLLGSGLGNMNKFKSAIVAMKNNVVNNAKPISRLQQNRSKSPIIKKTQLTVNNNQKSPIQPNKFSSGNKTFLKPALKINNIQKPPKLSKEDSICIEPAIFKTSYDDDDKIVPKLQLPSNQYTNYDEQLRKIEQQEEKLKLEKEKILRYHP